jgi:hypothetical protein
VSLTTESNMSDKDEWNDVEVPESVEDSDKVEYEVEEEEVVESQPEESASVEEQKPKELEGIETEGAAKRIRQLIRQRKERDEQIQTLISQNETLSQSLGKKDQELFNVNKLSLDASEKQLNDKVELARQVYLEAFEEGNKERLLQAQEALNDAQADLKTVGSAKLNYEESPQEVQPREEVQPQPQQSFDPKAQEWATENEWFGKDTIRTAAALAIDAELKGEGYSPDDEEFYTEIDRRLQNAFPQNYERVQETEAEVASNTSQPAQVVSGASRSSPTSSRKVKLSKEDVRLAQKWNIPLEQYAAEKLKVTQADGEYTTVN